MTPGLKNAVNAVFRFLSRLRRPSKAGNLRRLRRRGERLEDLAVRVATAADIPALAALHVRTWRETYPGVRRPPSYKLREHQWREQFSQPDGSWFCYVVARADGGLVGFAKGIVFESDDPSTDAGQLNKIYLLRAYQRLGLGRRLLGHVTRRFVTQGVKSMTLYGTPQNASCAFNEAMGAERLYADNGEFHGGYRWGHLEELASRLASD